MGAGGKTANSAPIDGAALTPFLAWSVGGIRATAEDEADFFRGLFSGELLPRAQVAMMEDTSATGGAYGLGFHADPLATTTIAQLHEGDQHDLRSRLRPRRRLPRLLPAADLQPERHRELPRRHVVDDPREAKRASRDRGGRLCGSA